MTTYEDFRDVIRKALEAAPALTWTEIRTTAKLPQLFPNNGWVRRLEHDISLERRKDAHGIILWSLKTDASSKPPKPTERTGEATSRKQSGVE